MKRFLFALIICIAAPTAPAADGEGAYWSQRPETCRVFRRAMDSEKRTTSLANIRGWIEGYLTAYNRQTPDTYDILGISELDSVLQSIEAYCKAHPLDNLGAAMEAVTESLAAKRYRTRRQAGR